MEEAEQGQRLYSLWDGAVGGVIGATLMAGASMLAFPLFGIGGFWQPLNLIAAMFVPEWGRLEYFALWPVLVGATVHGLFSVMLGVAFAWLASWVGGRIIPDAVFAALVLWAVVDFVLLPVFNPVLTRHFPEWLFTLVHVLYAVALSGFLAWRGRRIEPEATHPAPAAT